MPPRAAPRWCRESEPRVRAEESASGVVAAGDARNAGAELAVGIGGGRAEADAGSTDEEDALEDEEVVEEDEEVVGRG